MRQLVYYTNINFRIQYLCSTILEPMVERGIDPGAQVDTSLVELAAETNPDIVRINFIDAFDTRVPVSVIRKYREIINAYRQKDIKVLGLVGAESVEGGYDPNDPEPFADKLAVAASKIVHFFGGKLEGLEIFNEPNDYMGGETHQVAPGTMAFFLTKVSEATSSRPQRRKLNLVSGPLFSHDLYDNVWADSGAEYLYNMLYAGFNTYGWTQDSLPIDEIGYHIYVGQGSIDPEVVAPLIVANLEEMKWVLGEFQIEVRFSISEIGWQSGIVGEEGQASNIATTHDVLSASSQVGRWLYFTLKDFNGYTWGVTDADGVKKLSFDILANLPR